MEPARIALVIGQTTGGIGRHVLALVDEIVLRGGIPAVFGPAATGAFGFQDRGAAFHVLEVPAKAAPGEILRQSRILEGALGEIDLVHAHGWRAGMVAGLASRRGGVAARILTIHNAVLDTGRRRSVLAWLAERMLAYLFTERICVSADLARAARAAVGSRAQRVRTIPVGAQVTPVPMQDARRVRDALGIPSGALLIVSVGRLDRQKGFDVLLESLHVLDSQNVVAAIAGEGPERPALESAIARYSLEDRIRLLGERADAQTVIAAADVFCMPSRWEGSPLALHEAMVSGRPIVATTTGGIIDMLHEDEAILVPAEDPSALVAALKRLLENPDLRRLLGESAAKASARWPDAAASAARVVELYEQTLGRGLDGR